MSRPRGVRLLLAAVLGLASCVPAAPPVARMAADDPLPAARRFTGAPTVTPAVPNARMGRDFMALTFALETGRAVPRFTRFEGTVTVAVEGDPPASLGPDLDDLLVRLRREARIDIRRAADGARGSITISALPRAELQRVVPGAACFVVPRVSGWAEYLANRNGRATDWTTLETRSRASVFLPSDVSAQEIRDCLHEEVAQALGPLNDLYRLPHSVFNDDNIHVALTDYDMTLLRATYDPALRSGMTRRQVAAQLPAILDRVNPRGRSARTLADPTTPVEWGTALRAAMALDGGDAARIRGARRALAIAREAGWTDERLAFSYLALGRAALVEDPAGAIDAFLEAGALYRGLFGDGIHAANVNVQIAAFALSAGRAEVAIAAADRAIPAARDAQNAALLSTLLLIRTEALAAAGRDGEAARSRRDALAWGRYAWGDAELAVRAREVATLAPRA